MAGSQSKGAAAAAAAPAEAAAGVGVGARVKAAATLGSWQKAAAWPAMNGKWLSSCEKTPTTSEGGESGGRGDTATRTIIALAKG